MNNPQISVIVPVYNAEKWLRRCVDSILAQTFTDFELLLIDDGSTDGSPAICDEYAVKDSRVRVFHKPNGGVSSARNLGLDHALGEWICFVDSDDRISNLEVLSTSRLSADMVLFTLKIVNDNGFSYDDSLIPLAEAADTKNGYLKKYLHFHIFNCVYAKLIRKSAIGILRFDTAIRFGEDALFNLRLMKSVNSIKLCNDVEYTYNSIGDYGKKYKNSIETAAGTMYLIFKAYQALQCRNLIFERNVFNCYRSICQEEWSKRPSLWNNDRKVSLVYSAIRDTFPVGFRIKYRLAATPIYGWYQYLKGRINVRKHNEDE